MDDKEVLHRAYKILEKRVKYDKSRKAITSPADMSDMLRFKWADTEHEIFSCVFLNNRHKIILIEDLFRGTVNGCSVEPREVVKRALELNASAVIFAHNHPSGNAEPSSADIKLTKRLADILDVVNIRVLDHIVIGHTTVAFSERGLL